MITSLSPNEKLEEYQETLISIYGNRVVDAFVEHRNNKCLGIRDGEIIDAFIDKPYCRFAGEGCQKCRTLYKKNANFEERKMDFPSWAGPLNFSKERVKKIMIIGEDISPAVKRVINIAYGLGRYNILSDGTVIEEPKNNLWRCLNRLFDGKTEFIKNNTYVTDISKCHAYKNKKIWRKCSN